MREFEFAPGIGFTVRDEVKTLNPAVLTWLLHVDDHFEKQDANKFLVNAGSVNMLIEVSEPKELKTALETNALTAPGPPGSVDKGERQERGQKLSVSTTMPTNAVRFVMHLRIEK